MCGCVVLTNDSRRQCYKLALDGATCRHHQPGGRLWENAIPVVEYIAARRE